jgi:hypothetical protein
LNTATLLRRDYAASAAQDLQERAELRMAQDFEAAAQRRNVAAIAPFAGYTKDWTAHRAGNTNAKRAQTVGEVLIDSLEGSQLRFEAMAILCEVAYGDASQVARARALIHNMGVAYAQQNVTVPA